MIEGGWAYYRRVFSYFIATIQATQDSSNEKEKRYPTHGCPPRASIVTLRISLCSLLQFKASSYPLSTLRPFGWYRHDRPPKCILTKPRRRSEVRSRKISRCLSSLTSIGQARETVQSFEMVMVKPVLATGFHPLQVLCAQSATRACLPAIVEIRLSEPVSDYTWQ